MSIEWISVAVIIVLFFAVGVPLALCAKEFFLIFRALHRMNNPPKGE